jgi:glycosyltransferase involved in cell wall biosynthesis
VKIIHASDYLPELHAKWAGAEIAAERIAQLEKDAGFDIKFITTELAPFSTGDSTVFPIKTSKEPIKTLEIMFHPTDSSIVGDVVRVLKQEHPDVLHLHNTTQLSLSVISCAKAFGIPIVYSVYDFWSFCVNGQLITADGQQCASFHGRECAKCWHTDHFLLRLLQRIGVMGFLFSHRRLIVNTYLRHVDAFIVLSQSWKQTLIQYGLPEEKIYVVPLPLIANSKECSTTVEPHSILFTGWVHQHKGLHVLVEALPQIAAEVPDVKLYVIESGIDEAYKSMLLEKLRLNNLDKAVVWLGKRSNEEVQEYLCRVQAVVVLDQWPIAWPIFLTEAMMAGKPVVASDIGGIPELIDGDTNGLLTEPTDANELARKLIWLLVNPEEAKMMGEYAKMDILRICNPQTITTQLTEIYKWVCSPGGESS